MITTIFISLLMIISMNKSAFAKEVLIEASGSYVMDPILDETYSSATDRAREEAKRNAVEKAGVYLQSYSKMVNLEISYDEVKTVAAKVLKIQDESRKIEVVEDNLLKFTINIKALVDDNNEKILETMMSDKQNLEEAVRRNNELQKEYDKLKQQMEELKKNYNNLSDTQKVEIKNSVALNNKYFKAAQELEKGNEFYQQKNFSNALQSYNLALELNPNLAEVYNNRGLIYYELGKYDQALQDYNSALNLRYNFAQALNNRGNVYAQLGQYQNALQDLQSAVNLSNNTAEIHNNLGSVYFSLKRYDEAVAEYTRAIQLNSNYADAYYNRSAAYYAQGKYSDASADIKRALNLNPNDSAAKDLNNRINQKLNR